ncbi:MAG: DUF1800 family protein, partial [Parvularculaceae bacterium]
LIEANSSARLSQQAYRSPSVFNFYRPGYVAAGSLTANSNLVAPEMQITTTASVTGFANFIQSRVEESGSNVSFRPGYDAEMTLANDPNALVDRLSLNMTAGAMTAETRASIIAAVSEIPIRPDNASQDRRRRVNAAMLMTVLSPEFYVQR